jgi:hypothetical protein
MKNRTRGIAFLLVVILFLFAGCSEDVRQSSLPAETSDADLTSTLLDIFTEPDRFDRLERMISVLRGVKAGQGDALAAALDGLKFPNRELDRVLITTAWSKIDPIAATKWVVNNERVEIVRLTMLDESVYEWALVDPEGLLRDPQMIVYKLKGWDRKTLRALIRGWYESGKPNLEEFVYTLPNLGDDRQRGVSALIESKLKHEGADAAIVWATTAATGGSVPYRQYVYGRLAGDIAMTDPERAIAWCNEVCDTKSGEEIPLWIARTWVMNSGAEAMDWITARDARIVPVRVGSRAAYRRLILRARDEAFAWMEGTTEEQRKQEAMQGPLFMYINERSGLGATTEAIEWTKYITGDSERDELLRRIVMRWLRQDPTAAEAWLAQSSLSEELKQKAHETNLKTPGPGRFRLKDMLLERSLSEQ